jgi:hypothetical protein
MRSSASSTHPDDPDVLAREAKFEAHRKLLIFSHRKSKRRCVKYPFLTFACICTI